jgi:superfamily II DNA or RNA helicase
MAPAAKLQTRILTRQANPGGYKVYRAGLEWDLTDPIVIESAEDFRSTPRWRDRLTPFHHQVKNLITFCRRLPVTLLADDVGLGKTVSAGLVMSELIVRGRLSKALIVCPKLLCPQWKQELEEKFDIQSVVATGRDLRDADPGGAGAVITTYNSARLHLDALPEDRFQMLVLDEAHKLRNLYGGQSPPQVATRFQKALEDRRFRFVLMLTATPIQNRLWDLYSLVDLLTTARGHENPFGSPGLFAQRFIADERTAARRLKIEKHDEFRSIVYGYMSRTRRGDAGLLFPDRTVQMHRVAPTEAELELIRTLAGPIQKMNKLVQISTLKALASSPEALQAQIGNMARKGTAPADLAAEVRRIVETMPPTAKLAGLAALINQLRQRNPEGWRVVVFTTLRETQTAIQTFLENQGLTVGIINGDSGERNQDTIARFKESPPRCRVVISTEAGSEGVNLQVANVLVNFDLPWNPMIVEQRIGRVQRLGSAFRNVSIFNITLRGTFEDVIVGRLMEKLQMAANAIGDIDSLLQGSEVATGEEDAAEMFEARVLKLVLDALAGKDVDEDVRLKTRSIEDARRTLEETNIDELLGRGGGGAGEYVGPRAPRLPPVARSMDAREFTLAALQMDGACVTEQEHGVYSVQTKDLQENICFEPPAGGERPLILYAPQTPAFQRLVKRTISSGVHDVAVADADPEPGSQSLAAQWAQRMGATFRDARVTAVTRAFSGAALLRVRATVAHDSYEQLVTCRCDGGVHRRTTEGRGGLEPVETIVRDPAVIGIDAARLREAGERDEAIAEFSRFYEERREVEMAAAGGDARKRKKLSDDFSPRIEMVLAGLEGEVGRDVALRVRYSYDGDGDYASEIVVRPGSGRIMREPETEVCAKSGRTVPKECLGPCEVSGVKVLQHLLVTSEFSNRTALPRFIERCQLSGKRALPDEIETSAVTRRRVASRLLKESAMSGKRAEPEHFGVCAFSKSEVLTSELAVSEISGRPYRVDQAMRSAVSGKSGHAHEFITCHETRQTIARAEAETCEVSGKAVRPGVLETCALTGKRVLPSLLAACQATGDRVLRNRLVTSSVSNALLRRDRAIESRSKLNTAGKFCLPAEAETCAWSGRMVHPDDLRSCALTGLAIHADYTTPHAPPRLRPLVEMLDGARHNMDQDGLWDRIAQRLKHALNGGTLRIEAAVLSPSRQRLAACAESRTMLGFRVHQVGAVYDLNDDALVGRLAEGKRDARGRVAR